MKRTFCTLVLSLCLSSAAFGDLYFKSRTWQEGDNASDAAKMTAQGWVDGASADIRIEESGNPLAAAGNRIVIQGETGDLYLVNDEEKTVSPWNMDQMLETMNQVMEAMGPLAKFKIENAKVETLLTEPGGEIAGRSTTHYRFRTEYDMTFKIMGMGQTQHISSVQDVWSTTEIDDLAFGAWFNRPPPDFGDSGLAELIALEQEKMQGFPLRTVTEQVTVGKKGKNQSTVRTINQVDVLEERSAPADAYTWPSDYQVVEMMPTAAMQGAGQEQEQEEPEEKKGWRSKIPFGKKKGGG